MRLRQVLTVVLAVALFTLAVGFVPLRTQPQRQLEGANGGRIQTHVQPPFVYQPSETMARLRELTPNVQVTTR